MSDNIQDTSLMLGTPPHSFLSLPDELIYAVIKAGGPGFRVPLLCKRLVPFYRSQIDYVSLYRSIKIKSLRGFRKLARTLSLNPSLGAFVQELEIDGVKKFTSDSSKGPTAQQLSIMFDNLPNLQVLCIVNSGAGCKAFFESNSSRCGPNLRALHLQGTYPGTEDPFSTSNLIGVANRMRIEKLELLLEPETRAVNLSPSSFLKLAYPSVESIALSGHLSASNSAKTIFERSKPSVVILSDSSPHPALSKIFSAFSYPESVEELSLSCRIHSTEPQDYRQELIRFTNLTSLELSHGAMSGAGSTFYNSIRKLTSLETLSFGRGCDVSVTELRHLVTPGSKKKHSSLKSLVLDNVYSKKGSWIESKNSHNWVFPQWTKKFTVKGLGELEKSAKEGGVELSGSSLSAEGIKNDFKDALAQVLDRQREIKWVANKRGCDWEEAEEILEKRDARERYYDEDHERWDDGEEEEEEEEEESSVWLT